MPAHHFSPQTRPTGTLSSALRLLRLAALLLILWYLLVETSLAARSLREAGVGLGSRQPAQPDVPALGVTVQWEESTRPERAKALERLAAANAGWVRLRAGWEIIEPEKGRFVWAALDAWVAEIDAAGLAPVLVLDGSPPWAQAAADRERASPLAPPEHPSDFAGFAAALAARYQAQVRFYQVWDEPNIAPHWGTRRIDPVGYAQLLASAAAAVRAADPDALILTASLAPTRDRGHLAVDEVHFLQRMLAAGAGDSFDAVALQPFGFGHSPLHPHQQVDTLNFQRVAAVRRALVAAGLGDRPIWGVRFGWNTRGDSEWGTVLPEDQERYAAEARALAARWPWLVTLGWAVDRPALPADDPFWGFALTGGVASALAGPLPAVPAPDPRRAGMILAGLSALALLAGAWAWRQTAGLPLARWQELFRAQPAAVQAALWAALLLTYHQATWPPLIATCWLTAAILVLARPETGVWLALATLPFFYQHKELHLGLWTISMPPATAAILVTAPSVVRLIWTRWRKGAHPQLRWTDWAAAFWLVLNVTAAGNVWHWPAYARGVLEIVLAPLGLYLAVRMLVAQSPRGVRTALAALAAGGLLLAAGGLVLWALGRGTEIDGVLRLVSAHYSPNHTALYLVRSFFVAAGLALAWSGPWRRGGLLAAAVIGLALLLTASRGAVVLGLPAGGLASLWLWAQRGDLPVGQRLRALLRRPKIRLLLVAVALTGIAGLIAGEARLLNRDSVDSRIILWQTAARLIQAHPLVGVGPGGFYWTYPTFMPIGALLETGLLHPHNLWLELAAGWGVGGVVWMVAVAAFWLLRCTSRIERLPHTLQWPAIGLTGALVAGLAHGQVDAFLVLPDLAGWLFGALGIWALLEATATAAPE